MKIRQYSIKVNGEWLDARIVINPTLQYLSPADRMEIQAREIERVRHQLANALVDRIEPMIREFDLSQEPEQVEEYESTLPKTYDFTITATNREFE